MASHEQNLVNDLIQTNSNHKPTPLLRILSSNVLAKKTCDLEFEGTIPSNGATWRFCLEVKSDKSSSMYNNVLLYFGDILKNRVLMQTKPYIPNISYGVLLEYHPKKGKTMDSFFIKQIQKYINPRDWDSFGTMYGCRYIFFYNDQTHELYYSEWAGFVTATSITKWF